ncbi:uncharacterized protein B0H18DRAFT_1125115, partial [Fomitopsis serialis]|uniref:uncharacterized protein n=1 Tax=Fomitopsis serialis TaxID=139415 RepID=UPI00200899B2
MELLHNTLRTQTGRLDQQWYFTDAKFAARLDAEHWISTPNMTWIPTVSLDTIELFHPKYTHLCVLPNPRMGVSELPISVLDNVGPESWRPSNTVDEHGNPLVLLHPDRRVVLAADLEFLHIQVSQFIAEDAAKSDRRGPENIHAALKNFALSASEAVERMRSIPVTLQRFLWEMREYQRYYAEASAYMDFVNTFNARMVDTKVHQTDSSLMGAISADPAVVSRLYRAGIPVWYIRRYSQLVPELKIQEVVEPSLPQERGVMILEYDPPYPTQY